MSHPGFPKPRDVTPDELAAQLSQSLVERVTEAQKKAAAKSSAVPIPRAPIVIGDPLPARRVVGGFGGSTAVETRPRKEEELRKAAESALKMEKEFRRLSAKTRGEGEVPSDESSSPDSSETRSSSSDSRDSGSDSEDSLDFGELLFLRDEKVPSPPATTASAASEPKQPKPAYQLTTEAVNAKRRIAAKTVQSVTGKELLSQLGITGRKDTHPVALAAPAPVGAPAPAATIVCVAAPAPLASATAKSITRK